MQAFQDAFISYGRRDSLNFADKLNRRLVDRGFTVWFDYDDIPLGVDYQKQIDDGIERADNFLFVISPHSINSPYCGLELELALKRNKRIIPLLHVERIDRAIWQARNPEGTEAEWADYQAKGLHDHFQNMHPILRKLNWIYVREGQDDFEKALAGLLEILDRHKDYVHQHTLLLAKALEWERQQKRSPYLLIGEERLQAEDWLKVRFTDSQPPCLPTDLHCEFITESRKNADNLMTEVFLAYADKDRPVAEQIRNSLRREGLTVWSNTTDIQAGEDFQQVIDRGIEEADNVVYLLSPASVRSPWCQHELDYALSLHKRIIPLRLEAIAPDLIPLKLRDLQYIDLADNLQESDYQQDESQLLRILRQDAAYHEDHKRLLTKALKWEEQKRNPTLLLRGYNLDHAEAWLKVANQNTAYPPVPLQEAFITESLHQPPGISLDVFISYSRADSGFARKLNHALQVQGKRTWFDQESIAAGTADFQQEIHRGIESADTFLFVLSPRSIASPYCADEVEYAANLNKRFVTLLYQPFDATGLHPELAKVQWLDFNQNGGDFSANLTELLRILDRDGEHIHAHTRLLLRAIEWEEKGRKESLLLRGDELEQAEQWLNQATGKEPQPTELQQSYLATSRTVEDAQQQATRILQEAVAKGRRRALIGSGVGAIGLLIAVIAGMKVYQANTEIQAAEVKEKTAASDAEFLSDQPFNALLKALEASQALKQFQPGQKEWSEFQPAVIGVLQQAVSEVREKNTLSGHQSLVSSLSFSPDGKTLASGSYDKTIKLWNVDTGQEARTLKGHQAAVNSISFSPDGKTLASASEDKTIKLWNVDTGQEVRTLKGHQATVSNISFSPDGKTLASGSEDKTIKLWNVDTGQEVRTLKGHQATVSNISFSPDGKTLASGSTDNTIKLWDVNTGKETHTLEGHQAAFSNISFSPDGKTLASGSYDKTIKLWDVNTGKETHTLEGHQSGVSSISFSPDGKTLASGSTDKTIKLWNVNTGKETHTLKGHQSWVFSLSFSPDGKTLASGSADKTIKLWNVNTGQESHTLKDHQDLVHRLSFSPDGKTFASGSYDNIIKLWNVNTGKEIRTLEGHQDAVNSISFSPDGKTIASGSADKTIKLWNVDTGKEIRALKGHQDAVNSISFSPDGKTIASGSADKTIKLWNVDTGKEVRTLKGHQDAVNSISFSPDGKTIASGGYDYTIKLWNVSTGQEIRTLEGHQLPVMSFSFSPDGKTLASGSYDKTIKLWDVNTGQEVYTLKGHQSAVISISFSPDGKTIVSGSDDGTIKLWIWDYDRLMSMSCNWIQEYLITHPDDLSLCKGYLPQS